MADSVFRHAEEDPTFVPFKGPANGGWVDVTAAEFAEQVSAVAKGLIASGVELGDRVAILSATRYEWVVIDYAIWTAGGCTVAIYETSAPDQAQWILEDSGDIAAGRRERPSTPTTLKDVTDAAPEPCARSCRSRAARSTSCRSAAQSSPTSSCTTRRHQVAASSPATLIYTSGTTGRPKGVQLTHSNFYAESSCRAAGAAATRCTPAGSTLMFLPLAHVFARAISFGAFDAKVTVAHTVRPRPRCSTSSPRSSRTSSSRCRACSRRCTTPPSRRRTTAARAGSSTRLPPPPSRRARRRTRAAPGSVSSSSTPCSTSSSTRSCAPPSAASASAPSPVAPRSARASATSSAASASRSTRATDSPRPAPPSPSTPPARRRSAPSASRSTATPRRSPRTANCSCRVRSSSAGTGTTSKATADSIRRRLVPHRRPRLDRRRGLHLDHRPQEGNHRHRGRQERLPRGPRGLAARAPADQPVPRRRRRQAVHRRADHPRSEDTARAGRNATGWPPTPRCPNW